MSYRASDGNLYDRKETPDEYRSRKGHSGGYWSPFWSRVQAYSGLTGSLCMFASALTAFSTEGTTALLSILGLIIYRISRWNAWERKLLFPFVSLIVLIAVALTFIGSALIASIMLLLAGFGSLLDVLDIAIFEPGDIVDDISGVTRLIFNRYTLAGVGIYVIFYLIYAH